ncbi:MAG: ABC transporter permease [Planctomycetota bacterium]
MSPFEFRVAIRHLQSNGLQTLLILAGVALGIVAYTFIAALINGLAIKLTNDVIGNIAHVVLEPPDRDPRVLWPSERRRVLVAVQRSNELRPRIEGYATLVDSIEAMGGVAAVAPQVVGNGFFQRGEKIKPVGITGVPIEAISSIIDFDSNIVRGTTRLGPGDVMIGIRLADELGVTVGQQLRMLSERGRERNLRVRGVFDVGSANVNERLAFCDLRTAQSLLELEGAVSEIAIDLVDFETAPKTAQRLEAATGYRARDWVSENKNLQDALRGQGSTGSLIKLFSLLTIVIGVASVLLLAGMRRQAEIGILRSMGATRGCIRRIFQLQGLVIGAVGASVGAGCGWLICRSLELFARRADGSLVLPVDSSAGEYGTAITLATLAATVASVLPAWRAAKVDPVEVIQQ